MKTFALVVVLFWSTLGFANTLYCELPYESQDSISPVESGSLELNLKAQVVSLMHLQDLMVMADPDSNASEDVVIAQDVIGERGIGNMTFFNLGRATMIYTDANVVLGVPTDFLKKKKFTGVLSFDKENRTVATKYLNCELR